MISILRNKFLHLKSSPYILKKRSNFKTNFKRMLTTGHELRSTDTITTIDCNYMETPYHSAAYLIKEGDTAAFIDNNTSKSIPQLLKALEENNLKPEQVKYIIITHIHLDHAGGK